MIGSQAHHANGHWHAVLGMSAIMRVGEGIMRGRLLLL